MYLLYVDHSGEIANPQETYFVMGAVAVFERQLYFLTNELNRLQDKYLPDIKEDIEFHASVMRNHSKPPWDKMPKVERENLMSDIYKTIATSHRPGICLFGQAIEKKCVIPNFASRMSAALQNKEETENVLDIARGEEKNQAKQRLVEAEAQCQSLISPIITRGFEGLCIQFEYFLGRFHDATNREKEQRGLIIVDHASYEKDLELLMHEFRAYGTRAIEIYNIVEAPFCTNSYSTRMLQVADFVSYAIFRRYESNDILYFNLIDKRFDELGGVIHGLAHTTSDPDCKCPACLSRTMFKGKP